MFAYRSNLSNLIRANLVNDGCTFRPETGPGWWHKAVALLLFLGLCLRGKSQAQMGSSLETKTWRLSLCRQVYICMGHANTDRQNNCFMKKLVKNNT